MTARLSQFVESHPSGWNHDEWLALLADLGQNGADVSNPEEIGIELEKTRVIWELQRRAVPGLGPKRIKALADRFVSLWQIQNASVEDMARVPGMTRALAQKVHEAQSGPNGHS